VSTFCHVDLLSFDVLSFDVLSFDVLYVHLFDISFNKQLLDVGSGGTLLPAGGRLRRNSAAATFAPVQVSPAYVMFKFETNLLP
jgi:hypothetical protein